MNNCERLLYLSEKKVATQMNELKLLKQQLTQQAAEVASLQSQLQAADSKCQLSQARVEDQSKEMRILEEERTILLGQIRQQQEFIIGMNELKQNSILKRTELVMQLDYSIGEVNRMTTQFTQEQASNAENRRRIAELENQLEDYMGQLNSKNQREQLEKQRVIGILAEREQIIKELEQRIRQFETQENRQMQQDVSLDYESENETEVNETLKQQLLDEEKCIVQLREQLIQKEDRIITLERQIVKLQNSQNQVQITQEQIVQSIPGLLRQKVVHLQQLTQLIPMLVSRITNISIKQDDVQSQLQDAKQLHQTNQALLKQYNQEKQHRQQIEDEYKYLIGESEKLLKENWQIKEYLLKQQGNSQTVQLLQSLRNTSLNLSKSPFDSLKELLESYLQIQQKINRIAQQQFIDMI